MNNLKRNAFSLSEVLITLGLIGILAVTMISMNNFAGYNSKVAVTRLSQADSAIQAWGKSLAKGNETGLGAAEVVQDNETLQESFKEYFETIDTQDVQITGSQIKSSGEVNGTEFTLNNGVKIVLKYTGDGASVQNGFTQDNLSLANLAYVTASVQNRNETITQEYALTKSGVIDVASQFEGWAQFKVYDFADGTRGYCNPPKKSDATTGNEPSACDDPKQNECTPKLYCTPVTTDGEYVYINTIDYKPCPNGKNGSILVQKIGTVSGVFESEEPQCCDKPQIWKNGKCSCPGEDAMVIEPGYGYVDDTAKGCKVKCKPGQYSKDKRCVLCEINHQCPSVGMSESLDCQAGYICPKDTDIKNDKRYHGSKFNGAGDPIAEGGLINQQICPKGTYQPNTNAEDCLLCPAGHYCPTDGTIKPTPCPAGTYYDPSQDETLSTDAVCVKCPQNTFNPNEAYVPKAPVTTCPACPSGTWTNDIGATVCTVCPAGQYYSKKEQMCKPCPKGYYCPTSGLDGEPGEPNGPIPCECGMYQDKEGQTQCLVVPVGTYPTDGTKPSNAQTPVAANHILSLAATTAELCPKGHMCPGGCPNTNGGGDGTSAEDGSGAVRKCLPGYFQSENGKFKCNPCSCGTYQPKSAAISCLTVAPGRYPTRDKAYTKSAATDATECNTGYYCLGGCSNQQACTGNTYTSKRNQSSCASCPIVSNGYSSARLYPNANHTYCVGCPTPPPNVWYHVAGYPESGRTYSSPMTGRSTLDYFSCPAYVTFYDPIILDLKDNGLNLTSPNDGVEFDIVGDGNLQKIAWTAEQNEFDDAFLCIDRNNDGQINDGTELFGDQSGAATGLDELAKYDDNKDGLITKEDAIFSDLLLWADMNKNAKVDEGELKHVTDLNITEISTSYDTITDQNGNVIVDTHGNQVGIVGWFKQVFEEVVDGVTTLVEKIGKIIDVFFAAAK